MRDHVGREGAVRAHGTVVGAASGLGIRNGPLAAQGQFVRRPNAPSSSPQLDPLPLSEEPGKQSVLRPGEPPERTAVQVEPAFAVAVTPDPLLREFLGAALSEAGLPQLVFAEPGEAWAFLDSTGPPVVLVLDHRLPAEAAEKLRDELQARGTVPPSMFTLVIGADGGVGTISEGAVHLPRPASAEEASMVLEPAFWILRLTQQTRELGSALRTRAARDPLTGLWSRAAILDVLDREVERVQREGGALAVGLLDLDHFKRINDTHGHLVGDAVLREVGRRITTSGRRYDLVGRYGGDEFLVVLPGCNLVVARAVLERLRAKVMERPVTTPVGEVPVGFSVGGTAWTQGDCASQQLVDLADIGLYRAKRAGRGRVGMVPCLPRGRELVRRRTTIEEDED